MDRLLVDYLASLPKYGALAKPDGIKFTGYMMDEPSSDWTWVVDGLNHPNIICYSLLTLSSYWNVPFNHI